MGRGRNKGRSKPLLKNKPREFDQIQQDAKPENKEKMDNLPQDPDLPGCGQCYCVQCAKHFMSKEALEKHFNTKDHKQRAKKLKTDKPWTPEAARGLVDNGPKLGNNILKPPTTETPAATTTTTPKTTAKPKKPSTTTGTVKKNPKTLKGIRGASRRPPPPQQLQPQAPSSSAATNSAATTQPIEIEDSDSDDDTPVSFFDHPTDVYATATTTQQQT
ncbi:bud site selection protein 20 [Pelomyxa schiedti]|nr:bud site selection protein 20 [Pelomyxa schiedti]